MSSYISTELLTSYDEPTSARAPCEQRLADESHRGMVREMRSRSHLGGRPRVLDATDAEPPVGSCPRLGSRELYMLITATLR